MFHGRRRDIGLGPFREVSLADARAKVGEFRQSIRKGEDPLAARQRERETPCFQEYARRLYEDIKGDFRNEKHAQIWIRSLELYAFPTLGKTRLDLIDSKAVRDALLPIWFEKRETAKRVRQRVTRVLDAAASEGLRSGENPAPMAMRGLPRNGGGVAHFKALPYQDVPNFIRDLRNAGMTPTGALAFEFLILTAARTSETLNAQWSEIDFEKALWTVPAARMKAGKAHLVPLSKRAVAILRNAKKIAGNPEPTDFVFPSPTAGKPFSNGIFLAAVKRMQVDATPHGFRSAFRDWSEEKTNFSREVKESALAHAIKDKTEAAYRRTKLLDARRELMAQWADFLGASV